MGGVTRWEIGDDWHAQLRKVVGQHFFELQAVLAGLGVAVAELPQDHAGHALELATQAELRQVAINAVGAFPHILEKQNPAPGLDFVRSSHQRRDEREIAPGQPPAGDAGMKQLGARAFRTLAR